jgi:hypothetical protein
MLQRSMPLARLTDDGEPSCCRRSGNARGERIVEAHEVGDTITEATHKAHSDDRFRRAAAVFLGVLGMLLAIASLGGENAMKDTINSNILASDTYSFYQARYLRQTSYQLAADALDALLTAHPDLSADARAGLVKRIADYRAIAARHDKETSADQQGLLAKARGYEAQREVAQRRDINFDYSRAFYQIAIVLGSVSIVAASRPLLWLAGLLGLAATLLAVNGFLLLIELPVG